MRRGQRVAHGGHHELSPTDQFLYRRAFSGQMRGSHGRYGSGCGWRKLRAGPAVMLPLLRQMRKATKTPIAAQPSAFLTTAECESFTRLPQFPDNLETIQLSRTEFIDFGRRARAEGIGYIGGCCGCNAAYVRALADGLSEDTGRGRDS